MGESSVESGRSGRVLQGRLEASAAGLEELSILRQSHQARVQQAKLLLTTRNKKSGSLSDIALHTDNENGSRQGLHDSGFLDGPPLRRASYSGPIGRFSIASSSSSAQENSQSSHTDEDKWCKRRPINPGCEVQLEKQLSELASLEPSTTPTLPVSNDNGFLEDYMDSSDIVTDNILTVYAKQFTQPKTLQGSQRTYHFPSPMHAVLLQYDKATADGNKGSQNKDTEFYRVRRKSSFCSKEHLSSTDKTVPVEESSKQGVSSGESKERLSESNDAYNKQTEPELLDDVFESDTSKSNQNISQDSPPPLPRKHKKRPAQRPSDNAVTNYVDFPCKRPLSDSASLQKHATQRQTKCTSVKQAKSAHVTESNPSTMPQINCASITHSKSVNIPQWKSATLPQTNSASSFPNKSGVMHHSQSTLSPKNSLSFTETKAATMPHSKSSMLQIKASTLTQSKSSNRSPNSHISQKTYMPMTEKKIVNMTQENKPTKLNTTQTLTTMQYSVNSSRPISHRNPSCVTQESETSCVAYTNCVVRSIPQIKTSTSYSVPPSNDVCKTQTRSSGSQIKPSDTPQNKPSTIIETTVTPETQTKSAAKHQMKHTSGLQRGSSAVSQEKTVYMPQTRYFSLATSTSINFSQIKSSCTTPKDSACIQQTNPMFSSQEKNASMQPTQSITRPVAKIKSSTLPQNKSASMPDTTQMIHNKSATMPQTKSALTESPSDSLCRKKLSGSSRTSDSSRAQGMCSSTSSHGSLTSSEEGYFSHPGSPQSRRRPHKLSIQSDVSFASTGSNHCPAEHCSDEENIDKEHKSSANHKSEHKRKIVSDKKNKQMSLVERDKKLTRHVNNKSSEMFIFKTENRSTVKDTFV